MLNNKKSVAGQKLIETFLFILMCRIRSCTVFINILYIIYVEGYAKNIHHGATQRGAESVLRLMAKSIHLCNNNACNRALARVLQRSFHVRTTIISINNLLRHLVLYSTRYYLPTYFPYSVSKGSKKDLACFLSYCVQ